MEVFDQDRLARLAAAAREVNGATAQRPEHDSPPTAARAHAVRGADRWLARPALWLAVRCLGALAVLAVGAVHLHEYFGLYSAIPTIGTLFGFMEPGYDPAGILASRVAEGATVALLGAFLAARFVGRVPTGRW